MDTTGVGTNPTSLIKEGVKDLTPSLSGIPIVFLHAFPLSREMWKDTLPFFQRNFQPIAFDFPGFGNSAITEKTASMEFMARSVVGTLDSLNIKEKAIFVGVSMGGYVLFRLLDLFPDRVRAAALVSTRAKPDTEQARAGRFKNIELVEKEGLHPFAEKMAGALLGKTTQAEKPELVSWMKESIQKANASGVIAALRGMAERPDSTALLSKIAAPVLSIAGAEDGVIPSTEMREMTAQIPKAEFHEIPGCGHLPPLEAPPVFNDLFMAFLKRRVL